MSIVVVRAVMLGSDGRVWRKEDWRDGEHIPASFGRVAMQVSAAELRILNVGVRRKLRLAIVAARAGEFHNRVANEAFGFAFRLADCGKSFFGKIDSRPADKLYVITRLADSHCQLCVESGSQ